MPSLSHRSKLRRIWCLTISACLLAGLSLGAVEEQALEHQVKAAFLLNFTKFVDWPDSAFTDAHSPIAICVLGEDPFGSALDQIVEGESVGGRKVIVRRIREAPGPRQCQVLFLGGPIKDLPQILSGLSPGVLTVGEEHDGFLRAGGVISFVIENRRVRFDISQGAAENAGLKLSSRLLRVARSVEK